MAAIRLVSGVQREIWQEFAPQGGGVVQTVQTGIRISPQQLCRVQGLVTVVNATGNPFLTAGVGINNGKLVVAISNTAAGGNTATWVLDVRLVPSISQANNGTFGLILVAQGIGGGLAAPETLAIAYNLGALAVDQTLALDDAKGGGLLVDGSGGGFTTGPALEVRQNALHDLPLLVSRYINQSAGPDIQLFHSRGAVGLPLDIVANDELGALEFYGRIGGVSVLGDRIVAVQLNVAPNSTALDFYVTPRGAVAPAQALRLNADGAGSNTVAIFYNHAEIVPNIDHDGSVGRVDLRWATAHIDTVDAYLNVCLGGATPGTNANQTVVLPSTGTVEPTDTVNLTHLYSFLFGGGGLGTNNAALAITTAEPVVGGAAFADYQTGIPLRYNGKEYYLLARDMSPA